MKPSAASLIAPLSRATQAGVVKWEPDPSGGYLVRFGPNIVNVYDRPDFGIRIMADDGRLVDWVGDEDSAQYGPLIADLYELADRQFRDVDHIVTDILRRLGEQAGTPS